MQTLFSQIEKCRKCKTINGYKKFPINAHGNLSPFAVLVSEAPGKDSLTQQKYWVGTGGKILRECLPSGTELEELFYLTDIVKCWPNRNLENRKPENTEIENCSPFLIKEIETLKPKLILSFGGTSSSFLLKREVKITQEHGKISQFDNQTKIITLLHPSGIDRFMDRRLYKIQLALLFLKVKDRDLSDIPEIFEESNALILPEKKEHKPITQSVKKTIAGNDFTIPTPGNSITQTDVRKNQIRITADLKKFFPSRSATILIDYKDTVFEVKFSHRINKSHLLLLGSELASLINLKEGMSLKMSIKEHNKYKIY
jgi:DNA polymerase